MKVDVGHFYEGVSDKTEPYTVTKNASAITIDGASERDVLISIRAFNSISDFDTRKRLLDLVTSISGE